MRIHIATDHAGLEASHAIQAHLKQNGHEVIDHGPKTYDPLDDYPAFCIQAALNVVRDQKQKLEVCGIVLGGSGNGEQIAANKVSGIRCALVWNQNTAVLARSHNDANMLSLGAREHTIEQILEFVDAFLAEPFSGDERHIRRIQHIAAQEQQECCS